MRDLNARLTLKSASHGILLVLIHGLVKCASHDSVHHAPQRTTRMTVVCKNSRKMWICLWAGESGAACDGRWEAAVLACHVGTALRTPDLHWRMAFEALMGFWRQLCNFLLLNTFDMSQQTPLHEMQTESVSALAKDDKRCSGRCVSRELQNPSLNGSPGVLSTLSWKEQGCCS